MKMLWTSGMQLFMAFMVLLLLAGCGSEEMPAAARYQQPDTLFSKVLSNVDESNDLQVVLEIDHSRLGAEAGSAMPPARVLLFSNPRLEAQLIKHNPLTAIDLPLRILAFELELEGPAMVIYNDLLAIAERQRVGKSIPLRVINYRLNSVFEDVLKP